jgi:hypothetical protein
MQDLEELESTGTKMLKKIRQARAPSKSPPLLSLSLSSRSNSRLDSIPKLEGKLVFFLIAGSLILLL